jgi:hypothetical protein
MFGDIADVRVGDERYLLDALVLLIIVVVED